MLNRQRNKSKLGNNHILHFDRWRAHCFVLKLFFVPGWFICLLGRNMNILIFYRYVVYLEIFVIYSVVEECFVIGIIRG